VLPRPDRARSDWRQLKQRRAGRHRGSGTRDGRCQSSRYWRRHLHAAALWHDDVAANRARARGILNLRELGLNTETLHRFRRQLHRRQIGFGLRLADGGGWFMSGRRWLFSRTGRDDQE
jgi:hypothetical protein